MARDMSRFLPASKTATRWAAGAAAVLTGAAVIVAQRAARAERANLPKGTFVTADGVRLHVVDEGQGRPVVFLHGNGMMVEDMLISGVMGRAAQRSYRAVAIDRPGFGHSDRPRGVTWSAAAQAALLPEVFAQLGIERPIVVGHSLGAMIALALALDHPEQVGGLVLASGYYFPSVRADVVMVSPTAMPALGDLLSYTATPLIGELVAPRMIRKLFAPQAVPAGFARRFPIGMMLRPSQLRAATKDAMHMIPDAWAMSGRYRDLTCPIAILAGSSDKVVDLNAQARRLHDVLPGSMLDVWADAGHMIHHADPDRIVSAIDFVAESMQPGTAHGAGARSNRAEGLGA